MTLTSEEINVLQSLQAATRMLKYYSKDIRRSIEWTTLIEADIAEIKRYLIPIIGDLSAVERAFREAPAEKYDDCMLEDAPCV